MPLTKQVLRVSETLKKETLEAHQSSENLLLPYLTSIQSLNDYARILKMFYGFFYPVEQLIFSQVTKETIHDIDERRNARLILMNLESLGEKNVPALCQNLPAVKSLPQALGAMYVLEGSTLGGRMIARMLMKKDLFNESHLNFFNGYKDGTGSKWKDFQAVLDLHQHQAPIIIDAANSCFECFTQWMRQTLQNETK